MLLKLQLYVVIIIKKQLLKMVLNAKNHIFKYSLIVVFKQESLCYRFRKKIKTKPKIFLIFAFKF